MKLSFKGARNPSTRRQSSDSAFSEEELVSALEAARDINDSAAELVPSIADLLRRTQSQRVRDAAALTLSDLKDVRGAEAIVEVLRRPDIAKAAGTLVHALDEMGETLPFDILVSIILDGSYEARSMAITMLEDGRVAPIDPAVETAARHSFAALAASADRDGADAAHAALEGLDDLDRGTP